MSKLVKIFLTREELKVMMEALEWRMIDGVVESEEDPIVTAFEKIEERWKDKVSKIEKEPTRNGAKESCSKK